MNNKSLPEQTNFDVAFSVLPEQFKEITISKKLADKIIDDYPAKEIALWLQKEHNLFGHYKKSSLVRKINEIKRSYRHSLESNRNSPRSISTIEELKRLERIGEVQFERILDFRKKEKSTERKDPGLRNEIIEYRKIQLDLIAAKQNLGLYEKQDVENYSDNSKNMFVFNNNEIIGDPEMAEVVSNPISRNKILAAIKKYKENPRDEQESFAARFNVNSASIKEIIDVEPS